MRAAEQVAAERQRAQAKGYGPVHDDEHGFLGLLMQAIHYRLGGRKIAAAGLAMAAAEALCREVDREAEAPTASDRRVGTVIDLDPPSPFSATLAVGDAILDWQELAKLPVGSLIIDFDGDTGKAMPLPGPDMPWTNQRWRYGNELSHSLWADALIPLPARVVRIGPATTPTAQENPS